MQAVTYHRFGGPIGMESVADPEPEADGAVIRVEATGLCRSDWHGWQGHDPDIDRFPHVPGHEFAGTVVEVGRDVPQMYVGQRVTVPFVAGCGKCAECERGESQVCRAQYQPGFTGWGSFADLVAVRYAAGNLVPLPDHVSCVAAAAMGCRLGTAFRAVKVQGGVLPGQWVAVHGCGGVGLSAVMVARAMQARVIAVDCRDEPLELALDLGATLALKAEAGDDIGAAIQEVTKGGADVSIDALGSASTMANSVMCLRRQGTHVQVGLLTEKERVSATAIRRLVAWEINIAGSHGIQAQAYPEMIALMASGKLEPTRLVEQTLPLSAAPQGLAGMGQYSGRGITVFVPT